MSSVKTQCEEPTGYMIAGGAKEIQARMKTDRIAREKARREAGEAWRDTFLKSLENKTSY